MANANLNKVLERDIKSVKELRAAIKEYQDSLVGADATSEQYKETTDKLAVAQDELKAVTKAGREGVIQYADSIAGLEKKYRDMYNEYKQMSEAMRNSDAGKQQAADLKALSEQLNNLKKDVGNYKDNIGRYAESVMDAFSKMGGSVGGLVGPFKTATQGINAFNQTLKANPVMAVIGLVMTLINVIKQLVANVKSNEESQMRLNQAMAAFQPIIDATKNAMDKMGQAIVSVVEFLGKAVDKFREVKAAFTDFLGITKGAKEAVKEQQKLYQDLAKSVNDLTLKKREYQKANAEDKAEVERLREEASETTNLTEKKELLEQAKAKQAEIDQRNIEIAQEELRILETQSSLTANSAEDNEKLAAAVAKVSEAEAQAAANMRQFNKQLNTVTKSSGSAASGMKSLADEAKKVYERTVESEKTEITKLTEKYQAEKKLLEKYHKDTTLLTKQYNAEMVKLRQTEDEKEFARAKAAYTYWQKVQAERLKSQGKTEEEINQYFASANITLYNRLAETINRITGDTKQTTEEMLKNIEYEVNLFNQYGLQIDFPPEDWPEDTENALKTIVTYVVAYGKNLKTALDDANKIVKENSLSKAFEEANKKIDTKVNLKVEMNLEEMLKEFEVGITENNFTELLTRQTRETLQVEQDALREEIENFKGTQEQKLELVQRYYEVTAEMRQMDFDAESLNAERTSQVWTDAFSAFDNVASSINTISNSFTQLMQAEIQSGKLTDQEAKKKKKTMENLAKVTLAVNIAQIAASTAAGVMDVWKSYSSELALNAQTAAATGPAAAATKAVLDAKSLASAILKTTGLGVNAAAQIAAARGSYVTTVNSLRDEGSAGAAAASVATPTTIDSTPYTYSRTLQTAEEEERLNQPIWVSVSDIESGLNNRVKVTDEASF